SRNLLFKKLTVVDRKNGSHSSSIVHKKVVLNHRQIIEKSGSFWFEKYHIKVCHRSARKLSKKRRAVDRKS
ncbi:hypothetical protein, partial [Vibrio parahaemolyticus]|uniref:hypothetical protein n=1 Tax=Vibrio parahaemolyticus TaxID=670 RepID=UPI001C5D7752